jgi:holo-[acyl-carrier protein] synthase
MHCVGVDIVEIARVEGAVSRWGEHFLGHVYTPREVEFCCHRFACLAARFAAKEAVMKALGLGFTSVGWREIEILPSLDGKPSICLYGRAESRARELGLREITISLSHSSDYAIAFVVGFPITD